MKQFAKLMLLTLGFGLLAAMTGLVGPQPKSTNAAVAAAVNVVNTPNVNVVNTPGVNATQAGPWNVGINNTPNVNIANTPTVNLAPNTTVGVTGGNFSFSNTPSTPLFNRDIDNPANQPVEFTLCRDRGAFAGICAGLNLSDSITVPIVPTNGNNVQRVVIEQVSGYCTGHAGAAPTVILITNFAGAYGPVTDSQHYFSMSPSALNGYQTFSQLTRLYQDPHQTLRFDVIGQNTICVATISGYAVLQ